MIFFLIILFLFIFKFYIFIYFNFYYFHFSINYSFGNTALHIACSVGNLYAVEQLMVKNANANLENSYKELPKDLIPLDSPQKEAILQILSTTKIIGSRRKNARQITITEYLFLFIFIYFYF